MNDLKIGDLVSWESQSGGFSKKKIGRVFFIVPSFTQPPSKYSFPNFKFMYDGMPRNFKSYVIAVEDSKTGKGMTKLYWPLPQKLIKE